MLHGINPSASLPEAYEAFQRMCNQSVVSWNSIITGYAQHGDSSAALALFQTMKKNGFTPDRITFLSLLKACANRGVIGHARFAHDQIINSKIQVDIVMGSAMIDMYAKCGSIVEANRAFYKLSNPNIFSWSTIIAAHAEEEESFVALAYFEEMQQGGIVPNDVTFLGVLKACTCIGDVFYGRHIHCQIIGSTLTNNVVLGTTLIDMYAKCGSLQEALKTFDKLPTRNGISWGAIIEGHYQDGQGEAALNCFESMQQERVGPDIVTFLNVLKICTNTGDVVHGRLIHQQVITSSLQLNLVIGNSLIDMYAKCRRLVEACIVLDSLPDRNVVSWGAMIAGYVQHGESILALRHFKMMQEENINPDMVTLSCVLRACANTGNIEQGRVVHDQIIMRESELDVIIGSALVDMYVKCGRIDEAHTIFEKYPYKNVISWGVMIGGYAQHGEGLLALQVFEQMQGEGIKPDEVSFTCLLFACTHSGLVEEGRWYFRCMKEVYNIMPNTSHFACMVDLLGRAGFLSEAEAVLQSTIQMNIIGWTSLLNACCMHGDRELGKHCFEQVGILDPDYVGGYLLISNMYAS